MRKINKSLRRSRKNYSRKKSSKKEAGMLGIKNKKEIENKNKAEKNHLNKKAFKIKVKFSKNNNPSELLDYRAFFSLEKGVEDSLNIVLYIYNNSYELIDRLSINLPSLLNYNLPQNIILRKRDKDNFTSNKIEFIENYVNEGNILFLFDMNFSNTELKFDKQNLVENTSFLKGLYDIIVSLFTMIKDKEIIQIERVNYSNIKINQETEFISEINKLGIYNSISELKQHRGFKFYENKLEEIKTKNSDLKQKIAIISKYKKEYLEQISKLMFLNVEINNKINKAQIVLDKAKQNYEKRIKPVEQLHQEELEIEEVVLNTVPETTKLIDELESKVMNLAKEIVETLNPVIWQEREGKYYNQENNKEETQLPKGINDWFIYQNPDKTVEQEYFYHNPFFGNSRWEKPIEIVSTGGKPTRRTSKNRRVSRRQKRRTRSQNRRRKSQRTRSQRRRRRSQRRSRK